MGFDNKELISLIEKKFRTHREFGVAMGWTDAKTSYKLKDFSTWDHEDMDRAIRVLDIAASNLKRYFFTRKVQEN